MILRSMLPWALVLSLIAGLVHPAHAQKELGPPAIPVEGSEVFRYLLKSRHFTAIPTVAELEQHSPEDTLLILFGKPDLRAQLRETIVDLRKFQIEGGNVLLASDYAQGVSEYGVRIVGGNGAVGYNPHYRESPLCPLIKALEPDAPASFRPLTRGLATNRPAYFAEVFIAAGRRPPPLLPLAGFNSIWTITQTGPTETIKQQKEQQKHHVTRPNGSLMLPYAYLVNNDAKSTGRALLMAGHGCFTNGMLLQPDNDNFSFALQCLDWLGKRPDGKSRGHALFIVDGNVVGSFDVGLRPPLPPIPRPSIAVVNELLHGIEKERLLFRLLNEADAEVLRAAVRVGLVFLTLLLLCYGAMKLIDQRHHSERGAALLAGPYAVPPDQSSLLQERARSQIERNALAAEARALVRAWFLDRCAIPVGAWDGATGGPTPDMQIAGGWWQRYRVRRQIDRLARLAGPIMPSSFSWTELVRLTKTLQLLNAAVQEGRLHLAGCSPGENS
jgi:hypothetical protein